MAKKFVRGITDVKTINNQDFDTNNVNDLLSDGQNNYIHRKKGNSEEYHNLTNNIKTIEAEDNGLLTVRNYNNSTNSAKLTVHHDPQKEQLLESTDNTIVITHGENGTEETTTVDVNPAKVLTHDNLESTNETILITHGENGTDETTSVDVNPAKVLTYDNLELGYGLSKQKVQGKINLLYFPTVVSGNFNLNNLTCGNVKSNRFQNAPKANTWFFVSSFPESNYNFQEAVEMNDENTTYRRTRNHSGVWGEWREQVTDKADIQSMIEQAIQQAMSTNAQTNVEKEETE